MSERPSPPAPLPVGEGRKLRRPIVAANWKMHTTPAQARELAAHTLAALGANERARVEIVLCPPSVALAGVREVLGGAMALGAQNMYWQEQGAFTGEVSPTMLAELCTYVIVGHSERRQHFGETDEMVHRKVQAALHHHLTPIICVGETLELRKAGQTHDWIAIQVRAALHGLHVHELERVVVAYEPIWAIGTGVPAAGHDANEVALVIRRVLAELGGSAAAGAVRVQYGGSVNAANAAEFLAQPEIDGALVGGASLKPTDFAAIVRAVPSTAA